MERSLRSHYCIASPQSFALYRNDLNLHPADPYPDFRPRTMSFNIKELDGATVRVEFFRMSDAWKQTSDAPAVSILGDGTVASDGPIEITNKWTEDCILVRLELADGRAVLLWPYAGSDAHAPGHLALNVEGEDGIAELKPQHFPEYKD